MKGLIFQNRWAALIFAGVILLGTISLVGTEEDGGQLQGVVDDFSQTKADFAQQASDYSAPQPAPAPRRKASSSFLSSSSDEDLIDDTEGIDPQGIDPQGFDPIPSRGNSEGPPSEIGPESREVSEQNAGRDIEAIITSRNAEIDLH